jgi:hypothetical protein
MSQNMDKDAAKLHAAVEGQSAAEQQVSIILAMISGTMQGMAATVIQNHLRRTEEQGKDEELERSIITYVKTWLINLEDPATGVTNKDIMWVLQDLGTVQQEMHKVAYFLLASAMEQVKEERDKAALAVQEPSPAVKH